MPAPIAAKFSQAVSETLRLPDVAQRFRAVSVTPVGSSSAEAASLINQEKERWCKVVAQLGLKIDWERNFASSNSNVERGHRTRFEST